jgi:2-polyprenyl-6-methoxyphenol hydroxylase-like FAD-dependent oxidoreductase
LAQNDISVVGAGPSGLFAAGELARHGVGVRLVEREAQRHRQARATAIQPGTLEILDSVGIFFAGATALSSSRKKGMSLRKLKHWH